MRTLILALIPGLLLGCGGDETATIGGGESTSSGSTGSSDPTAPSSDPSNPSDPTSPTTSDSDSNATTPGTSVGTSPDPTTATATATSTTVDPPETTTTTTDGETTTTGETTTGDTDTTTGAGLCGVEGPELEANLVHVGEDPGCGALEFAGQNMDVGLGPVYALDGCPCGANCLKPDPWTLTLDVPKDWGPGILPACPRIVVERQMGKGGCELIGMAIWDAQEPDGAPALYHLGSNLGTIAAVAGQLDLGTEVREECECADCCGVPTLVDLVFTGLKSMATVSEGQTGILGDMELGYEISNFQSHITGICDDSADFDWIARRLGKP